VVGVADQAEHRVAHDQRRLGRVEDDDGLAATGTPTTSIAWRSSR
jgi:hypothetical protein